MKKEIRKLKDSTIDFIKKYMIEELEITKPINEELLQDIENKCFEYDEEFADKEINPNYIIKDEEKCRKAGFAGADIFNCLEKGFVDYEDLNKRLGLLK